MNHLRTAIDRSFSSFASAIAANSSGRSHQYAARRGRQLCAPCMHAYAGHTPGNSVSEMGERMNGGAVKDERSPEKDAILTAGRREAEGEGGIRQVDFREETGVAEGHTI